MRANWNIWTRRVMKLLHSQWGGEFLCCFTAPSVYIALTDWVDGWWIGKDSEGSVRGLNLITSRNLTERNHKNPQDSQFPCYHSNRSPRTDDSTVLLLRHLVWRSICGLMVLSCKCTYMELGVLILILRFQFKNYIFHNSGPNLGKIASVCLLFINIQRYALRFNRYCALYVFQGKNWQ